ncbi:coiled-coil domain-containing protein [Sporosarcina obsidiansis]|uniref:hypothetical protein n=1 Tax=Sporosarcina obsidiansis TaxID=2660748 RepID=UPI00129AD246|nr:hypothetical protein [Sporosarcina obsidiansis]
MSLFINNDQHKNMYKNQEEIKDSNQKFFRSDPLSELLKEQQKINKSFYQSIGDLKMRGKQQKNRQNEYQDEMDQQFKEFKEFFDRKNKYVVQKLLDLEAGNRKLRQQFNNKQLSEEKWIEQINSIQKSNDEIIVQLTQYALTSEQIEKKVYEQITAQKKLNEQFLDQTESQLDVIKRLEIQEETFGETQKQVDHFLSIELKCHLNELKELHGKHEITEQKLMDLDTENQKLEQQFINNQLSSQEWINQMISIQKSNDVLREQLEQSARRSEEIEKKVDEQILAQKQKNEQVLELVKKQTDDINRIDNKEVISERVLRQIRALVEEQTAEKIKKLPAGNKIDADDVQVQKSKTTIHKLKKENPDLFQHIKKKKVVLIELEERSLKEDNNQQIECTLINQTERSERKGKEPEKSSFQKNDFRRNEGIQKTSLRRKKIFGDTKHNKKYYVNKKFSKYPRIDDF